MLTMTVQLFSFLRSALWQSQEDLPMELDEKETSSLLALAEQQTVIGLIADALIRYQVKLPKEYAFRVVGLTAQIRQASLQVTEELKSFVKLPLMDYAVVKGQTVAALYPEPLLRMSGDIDILVRDYPSARAVLKKHWYIELPERLIDKETAFSHNGVPYDIHTSLKEFGCRSHQRYWQELMTRDLILTEVDGASVPTLGPSVYAVYIFVHLFSHFIREGVGLRQLCDWAVVLHHYRDGIDADELVSMLSRLGFLKAYRAFGCILADQIGLPIFPIELTERDRRWSDKILADILQGGNFGHCSRKQRQSGWRYKVETLRLTVRKILRYWPLAPSELTMMIPRLVLLNLRLLLHK
ncbi:MAG: nucleotidyltransferase family protein [Prevotella sp.]|nr:nucleotidyltransferase family protein [Prevotella sp.]